MTRKANRPQDTGRRERSAVMLEIDLNNQQTRHAIDSDRLIEAGRRVLHGQGVRLGSLSIAVVEDATIHELNRRYLQHDYPTDVLSFLLEESPGQVVGEVVVSADTAAERCGEFGWTVHDELLLYVVHGVLHLVGFDDGTAAQRAAMRARERFYLSELGLSPRNDDSDAEEGEGSEDAEEAGP